MKQVSNYSKSAGFTLVELMIVVGIIGVLLTFSLGFFGDNVTSANRSEGRAALSAFAGRLEKCRSLYGAYNNGNCSALGDLPFITENNHYNITGVINVTISTLTATTNGGQTRDNDCTTLILDNTGQKTSTGNDPTVCW